MGQWLSVVFRTAGHRLFIDANSAQALRKSRMRESMRLNETAAVRATSVLGARDKDHSGLPLLYLGHGPRVSKWSLEVPDSQSLDVSTPRLVYSILDFYHLLDTLQICIGKYAQGTISRRTGLCPIQAEHQQLEA